MLSSSCEGTAAAGNEFSPLPVLERCAGASFGRAAGLFPRVFFTSIPTPNPTPMTTKPMNLPGAHAVRAVVPIVVLASLLMTGCAPLTYRGAFNDYSEVYADGQNHQMLLNLARLSQHHPPYFFQSGNIQANYTFSGNFTAQAQQPNSSSAYGVRPYSWLWNSLQFQGTRTSQPTFNFVPLVGGSFSAHLVAPLRPDMFNTFFAAGFPVDILMRSMIQQVQFTVGTNQFILNNIPTTENITNYARFLRLCEMLRDLQERGYLLLIPHEAGTNTQLRVAEFNETPNPKDVVDSFAQGYRWSTDSNHVWRVDRPQEPTNTLSFQLTPEALQYLQTKLQAGQLPYTHPDQVTNLLHILSPEVPPLGRVTLRSFLFTLEDMATEQEAFDKLMKANESFMKNEVPERQLRPLLRIAWNDVTEPLLPPLITVHYQGQTYQITDPREGFPNGYDSYNRDAFMLACTLFTQISLDPTELNYQQQYLLTR